MTRLAVSSQPCPRHRESPALARTFISEPFENVYGSVTSVSASSTGSSHRKSKLDNDKGRAVSANEPNWVIASIRAWLVPIRISYALHAAFRPGNLSWHRTRRLALQRISIGLISRLYERLLGLNPSPVIALNMLLAVAMNGGLEAAPAWRRGIEVTFLNRVCTSCARSNSETFERTLERPLRIARAVPLPGSAHHAASRSNVEHGSHARSIPVEGT
jgi:hypothetical protein